MIKNANLYKTLKYMLRFKKKILVFKRMKTYISKKAKVRINKLIIGATYPRHNYNYGTFSIDDGATFFVEDLFVVGTGCNITVEKNAKLEVNNSYINRDSKIYCFKSIKIGKNVIISEDVLIRDSDTHYIIEMGKKHSNTKDIVIDDNVWIGANSVILKGVHIGKNSVVAARKRCYKRCSGEQHCCRYTSKSD